jgi:hypothetical protein
MRAKEMPNVFRPGIRITLIKVTLDPTLLILVFLGMSSLAAKKKSSAFTSFGSLQTNPLTRTA